jgi:putative ABC transport system ATP-binding protein
MSSLVVNQVRKTFYQGSQEIPVLKGLDLTVKDGESVAILGPSGSGKSTLLSMIAGFDDPDKGDVVLLGQKMRGMSEDERARFRGKNIGFVFQQYHLISHLNAFENVLLPLTILEKENDAEVLKVLDQVGLSDRKNSFPHQLSGGESQRVAIARALVHKPKIIIADEPSGNLDVASGAKVMDVLFDAIRTNNTSLVLVTHSVELAKRCDRTLDLTNGVLVAR